MYEKRWHLSVGTVLTSRKDGSYLGRIGLASPCDSWDHGWQLALDWLRDFAKCPTRRSYELLTWEVQVRYF